MRYFLPITIALLTAVPGAAQSPEEVATAALEAAPIWDGHNDVPGQLRSRFGNVIADFDFTDTTGGAEVGRGPMQTDLMRARQGGLGAQFWSIYISASTPGPQAVQAALEQIDVTERLVAQNADTMVMAFTADDVEAALADGRLASLMGVEGGHMINDSLAVLRQFYDLGIRYMTLTHSANTSWADSADGNPDLGGLSDFGRDVVREMNRLGMVVDLSHVSADAMRDALDVSRAPVIFSHSNVSGVTEESRNVPDDVLDMMPANDGIVMLTFVGGFVSRDRNEWLAAHAGETARQEWLWQGQPERVAGIMAEWLASNPEPLATVSQLADHVDYIRDRIGVDHIGIGGDYDGWYSFPEGMEDVSGYPALFVELARRGYTQGELEKISNRNMMRVMRGVEAYAQSRAGDPPIESPAGG